MGEKVTLEDVYNTLSYQVWKTGLEIKTELRESGKRIGWGMGGRMYVRLNQWEENGFLQSRHRTIKEEERQLWKNLGFAQNDLIPQREYRRISTGIPERLQKRGGLERELVPSES